MDVVAGQKEMGKKGLKAMDKLESKVNKCLKIYWKNSLINLSQILLNILIKPK